MPHALNQHYCQRKQAILVHCNSIYLYMLLSVSYNPLSLQVTFRFTLQICKQLKRLNRKVIRVY